MGEISRFPFGRDLFLFNLQFPRVATEFQVATSLATTNNDFKLLSVTSATIS